MKKILKEEIIRFFFSVVAIFISVYLALQIQKNEVKHLSENNFRNIKKAIVVEAKSNLLILNNSYLKYYQTDKIIRQTLEIETSEDFLKDENFLSHANDDEINSLVEYQLILKKCNNFRDSDVMYKYDPEKYNQYKMELTNSFKYVLRDSKKAIKDVIRIYSE